jgi:hypothetical protein
MRSCSEKKKRKNNNDYNCDVNVTSIMHFDNSGAQSKMIAKLSHPITSRMVEHTVS